MIDHSNRTVTSKCDEVVIHRNDKNGMITLLLDTGPFLHLLNPSRSSHQDNHSASNSPITGTERDPRNQIPKRLAFPIHPNPKSQISISNTTGTPSIITTPPIRPNPLPSPHCHRLSRFHPIIPTPPIRLNRASDAPRGTQRLDDPIVPAPSLKRDRLNGVIFASSVCVDGRGDAVVPASPIGFDRGAVVAASSVCVDSVCGRRQGRGRDDGGKEGDEEGEEGFGFHGGWVCGCVLLGWW